jgi:hypothetical protein
MIDVDFSSKKNDRLSFFKKQGKFILFCIVIPKPTFSPRKSMFLDFMTFSGINWV